PARVNEPRPAPGSGGQAARVPARDPVHPHAGRRVTERHPTHREGVPAMSTTRENRSTTAPHPARHPDWPVQIRLAGQTAAPEGPVDMFMMYVMHHAFRRDLAKLTEAAQCTPVDDRVAWRLLQQRWEVFAEALHGHHTGEDA